MIFALRFAHGYDRSMADTGLAAARNVITSGPPVRTILKLALPTVAAMVSQSLVNSVDTLFFGHLPEGESANAQGALFPSLVVLWALGGSLSAIGIGAQALTARRFAENNELDAGKVVFTAAAFTFVVSVLFTLFGYVIMDPALGVFIPGANVEGARHAAHAYMSYRLLGISSMALTAIYKAFFDGIGKTYVQFVSAVVMNVLNIGACFLLVLGNETLHIPRMGVRGAGLAAVVSTWLGFAIMIAFTLHPRYRKRFRPFKVAGYSSDLLKQILRLSVPSGLATIFVMTGFVLFARAAARIDDLHPTGHIVTGASGRPESITLAATNNIVTVLQPTFTACLGFGTATATLVSQCLGEKDGEKAERFGWSSIRIGLVIFGLLGACEAIFAKQIVGLLSHDPQVQDAALHPMQMMGVMTPIISVAMILTQALFGAGNTRFVMVVEFILHFMCLVPLAWLLGVRLDLGIVGLWSSAIVYIVLLAIAMTWKFKQGTWKTIQL